MMTTLIDRFYAVLDSSNINLDVFCSLYNADCTDFIEPKQSIQGKMLDFLNRMEIKDEK